MSILHRVHGHAKAHYHQHYRSKYQERAHLVYLFDAFLVSCALGLLMLGSYFRWYYHPLRDTFRLNITPVGEVVGGQETQLGIVIVNVGKTTLTHAHLTIHLPDGFLAVDGKNGVRQLDVPDLAPNVPIDYRIYGFLIGPPQRQKAVAHFTATGADGTQDEKLAATTLEWQRSLIAMDYALASSAVPGQSATFRLHIKNGSPLPFSKVSVKPTLPPGFKLIRSAPPLYRGAMALGDLSPGEEADLEFVGRFGAAADAQHFEATMTGLFEGQPFTLASAKNDVELVNAGLKLEAVFADPAPAYVKAGQEVPVTIRYVNEGDKTITHLTFSVKPDPSSIASVRWDDASSLVLKPGETGVRTVNVRLKDAISQYAVNPTLKVIPMASFDVADSELKNVEIEGASASTKIAGAAQLRTGARYFTNEGDQIGRGPLPPKVGKATTYWILANLQTGSSQIQNGTVTFTLPDGVVYTGRAAVTSGDDLRQSGDRLIWNLGTVEAHAGLAFEAPSASFEVSLTPTAAQVGTSPNLLNIAMFTGTDAWTGIDLSSNQDGLTTKLTGDPNVAGRTVVVK